MFQLKRRIECQNPKCGKFFWAKVSKGIVLDAFCRKCMNEMRMSEEGYRGANRKIRRAMERERKRITKEMIKGRRRKKRR